MFFSSHPKHLLPFLSNAFHQLVHHSRLRKVLNSSLKPFDVTLVRRGDYWQSWPHGIVQIERQNVEFTCIIDRSRRGGRRRRRSSSFGIPFSSSVSVDDTRRKREPAKKLTLLRLLFMSTTNRKMMQRTIQTTRRHHRRRPHLVRHKMAMTFPLNNCFATGRRIIDEESSFSRNRRKRGPKSGRRRLLQRFDDDDFDDAFRISSKSRWRNVIGTGKRAAKTLTVSSSSSSSSSWKQNEDDESSTTRTRTTTETTTTTSDVLKRLDEPVVLDWKALVRCFVKASVLSALLLRVWTILTRGGADAALTTAKSQRWFLLQKWFFASNQQSLGFGAVVGVVSFAAVLVILEKERASFPILWIPASFDCAQDMVRPG